MSATFDINGDPAVFDDLDDQPVKSLVKLTVRDHANG
jgi:hypothetical protein